jgi:hypothetical protein
MNYAPKSTSIGPKKQGARARTIALRGLLLAALAELFVNHFLVQEMNLKFHKELSESSEEEACGA